MDTALCFLLVLGGTVWGFLALLAKVYSPPKPVRKRRPRTSRAPVSTASQALDLPFIRVYERGEVPQADYRYSQEPAQGQGGPVDMGVPWRGV